MLEGEEGLDDLDGLDPMLTDPGVDDPNAEGDLDQGEPQPVVKPIPTFVLAGTLQGGKASVVKPTYDERFRPRE